MFVVLRINMMYNKDKVEPNIIGQFHKNRNMRKGDAVKWRGFGSKKQKER